MKLTHNTKLKPGMTLIELTVVILVLLTLISVLFIGAQAYKDGANRAACLLNLRNVQQGMRAQMNISENQPGGAVAVADVIGAGLYVETPPICPADPAKTNATSYTINGAVYPDLGTMWITCNIDSATHVPTDPTGW